MESLITYRNEAIKENSWSVNEETEKYYRLLDKATTRFISELEDIEKRCLDSKESPDALLNAVTNAINNISDVCEEFEQGVGYEKDVMKESQINFRKKTDHIISKSYFMNRARTWPQGYQGDYKALEGVYKNMPLSSGTGYSLDRYFLSLTLAVAVRGRLEILKKLLKAEITTKKGLKILDIACGSCREIFELALDIKESDAKVTCIDFDSDSLSFSSERISYTGLSEENITFRKYNAVRMVNHEKNLKEFGMQDIIYSVGFFDYLNDEVLIRLLNALYELLPPGGSLITSFKDCRRYRTFDYHWLLDWDGFLQRTEEDVWNLFEKAGIPHTKITTIREKSGVINFFTAVK